MRIALPATVLAACTLIIAAPALADPPPDHSQCVCDFHKEVTESTKYSRTFLRVIGSGFGLWGSTKKCKKVTSIKWVYDYTGPGDPPPGDMAPHPTPRHGFLPSSRADRWTFRWMNAESDCAGDPRRPDFTADSEMQTFIALDGRSFRVPFTDVTGTLESFLGSAYSANDYDPDYVDTDLWTGIEAELPAAVFVAPTLVLSIGSDPDTPVAGMMDLSSPDAKTLALDLGTTAANSPYQVLVSSTYQDDGPLGEVDGITVPIVFDDTTVEFLNNYPGLSGTTDTHGRASINLPMISDLSYEGKDLSLAAIVRNPSTGMVEQTSTYVGLALRDLSECGQ